MRSSSAGKGSSRTEFGTESTRRSTRRLSELAKRATRPRVVLLRNLGTEMPSVEMRRTTRVFGMVKGVDGARVLRSGRRLWPESSVVKLDRSRDGDGEEDWLKLMENNGGGAGLKPKGWTRTAHLASPKRNVAVPESEVVRKPVPSEGLADGLNEVKSFGIVYSRKRKRSNSNSSVNLGSQGGSEDRMFGRRFVRRQTRKKSGGESLVGTEQLDSHVSFVGPEVLGFTFQSSLGRRYWAARFLYSVLVYMTRGSLGLTELSEFLASEPISSFFASCGIQFSWVHSCTRSSGICKFFGAKQYIPLFSVDFSAVPLCFMYMHSRIHLRFKCLPTVKYLIDVYANDEVINECGDDQGEDCRIVVQEADHTENRSVLHPCVRVSKLPCRSIQYRNGITSRGIQKRRSSLRRRRSRNPSLVALRKPNGALVSELLSIRKNGLPFSSPASNHKHRRPVPTGSAGNLNAESSTMEGLTQDLDSSCCSANILITESDKCYRENGATVMLEMSSSGEWLLVVKKDGLTRYTHKAEKVMRPHSCNRFTHAIMWSADSSWKLEFPNRHDWFIFKDLYKECSDRIVPIPAVKFIPVPGVREVPGYADSHSTLFHRPDSYISLNDDEVSRAMSKRTANYDMDSDDEEWLKKFNRDFFAGNELYDYVSEDNFELMVDAFEKALYCKPYDLSDENAAPNLCVEMGRREVVEAVYSYWMNKRKQKRSSLLRVFQGHQVKRALLDPKPVMRKRRSFKRQPSQCGRGKQPSFLQAMAAEQDALQEQNAAHKVETAKAAADRSVDLAIRKRQRAQLLMQNADLATYKAAMAFRIAEAALVVGSPDAAAVYVLD